MKHTKKMNISGISFRAPGGALANSLHTKTPQIAEIQKTILAYFMRFATEISPDHPVLVDKYMFGKEVEIDAICDGENVFIPGIFEQIERAGVHSGDSMAVFPL